MLRFIEGGSGSGKSAAIAAEIRKAAENGNKCVLLVPEQYSFETEREYWQKLGALLSQNVMILSFERLADEAFRLYGGLAGDYADDTVKLLLMRESLKSCRPMLTLYGKNISRPEFISEMLSTTEEMKRAALTPVLLDETARTCSSSSLREKLRDLSVVYEGYEALLSQSFLDPSDRLERAEQKLRENSFFAGRKVFLDAYKSFTARQLAIIRLALIQADSVTVSLCLPDNPEIGLFGTVAKTEKQLRVLAARCSCPTESPEHLHTSLRFRSDALRHYSEQVLRAAPAPFSGENNSVFCAVLPSPFDEAEYVSASIARLVREGFRYEDIAVVGRDMDERAPALNAAFDRYRIPFFFDGGETADTMPLIRFVRRYCSLAAGNLQREEALAFLKCGILDIPMEEISAFEDYTYVWNLSGDKLREPFDKNPLGFSDRPMRLKEKNNLMMAEDVRSLLVHAADLLIKMTAKHDSLPQGIWAALEKLEVMPRMQKRISDFIEEKRELDAENERLSWDVLMEFLNGALKISELRSTEGEEDMTLREFRELLGLAASCTKLVKRPQTLDSVLLASAERVRIGDKKILFLVGAEDQVFPYVPSGGGLFTDRERKMLQQSGLLIQNNAEEKLIEERFSAYLTASAPSERLYISYASGDVAGKLRLPSVLVTDFSEIFPESHIVHRREMDPLDFCQSPSTAFLQYARCRGNESESPFAASLKEVLEEYDQYRPRMKRLELASSPERLVLEDSSLCKRLFGDLPVSSMNRKCHLSRTEPGEKFLIKERSTRKTTIQLSPSQIERFYGCPFAYFCRYGLSLRPRTRAELDPLSRGNVIHFLLEKILRDPSFTKLSDDELDARIQKHLSDYLFTAMGGIKDKSARFMYYYGRLRDILTDILHALQEEFSQSLFTVTGLEESISKGASIEPLSIDTPQAELLIRGKIDRVDCAELDGKRYVRIIDYKSGKREFKLEDARRGLNLQMLLYMFAIWQSSSGKYRDVHPAGILYMPAHPPVPSGDRDDFPSESGYQMNGLLLDDNTVLQAMEPSLAGHFLPVRMGKTGMNNKKCLISEEGFSELRSEAEALIQNMADELLTGKISPAPQKYGQGLFCSRCDFSAVCGHEGRN